MTVLSDRLFSKNTLKQISHFKLEELYWSGFSKFLKRCVKIGRCGFISMGRSSYEPLEEEDESVIDIEKRQY